jgi:uncharacterized protein (UPF0332 family)
VVQWDDFLELADELLERTDDEAAARTAISRAYYAAFHAGRAYLIQVNIRADAGGQAHSQVRQTLGEIDPWFRESLWRLHQWRKEADYENPSRLNVEKHPGLAVVLAREIIEKIRVIR